MPIGLQLGDGIDKQNRPQFENFSNGDGPVLGREFEIAELLSFVKQEKITNMVWFTADVHYCAAHYYDPDKAEFKNFEPFWEFVSGLWMQAVSGPHQLDNTFGPSWYFKKRRPAQTCHPCQAFSSSVKSTLTVKPCQWQLHWKTSRETPCLRRKFILQQPRHPLV